MAVYRIPDWCICYVGFVRGPFLFVGKPGENTSSAWSQERLRHRDSAVFSLCFFLYCRKKIKGELPIMKKIIMISLATLSISLVFVGFTKDKVFLLLLVTSLVGIAIGALLPTLDAIITQNIEKEQRGTITSFYMSSRFIGVAAGPPVMSLVMKNYLNMSYIISGIMGICIVLIVLKCISSDKKEAAQ